MGLFKRKKAPIVVSVTTNQENEPEVTREFTIEAAELFDASAHRTHFLPDDFHGVQEVADTLIRFKRLTINLQNMAKQDRQRMIDFLCGVMYGLNGTYNVIDKHMYQFNIPRNNNY